MVHVSSCGWLLSVLRAPTGTGIYPIKQRFSVNAPPKNIDSDATLKHHSTGSGVQSGNSNSNSNLHPTYSTSEAVGGGTTTPLFNGGNTYNIWTSCGVLAENGLDNTLGDLLQLIHQSSVAEVVLHLGLNQFAGRVRATDQLKSLYYKWKQLVYPDADDKGVVVDYSRMDDSENNDFCRHLLAVMEKNCWASQRIRTVFQHENSKNATTNSIVDHTKVTVNEVVNTASITDKNTKINGNCDNDNGGSTMNSCIPQEREVK